MFVSKTICNIEVSNTLRALALKEIILIPVNQLFNKSTYDSNRKHLKFFHYFDTSPTLYSF